MRLVRRAVPTQAVTYWLYRGLAGVGRYAPAPLGWAVSHLIVGISRRTMPQRAELIASHLTRISAGRLTGAELDRSVRAAFESYRRYWVDSARVSGRSGAELERRSSADGVHYIDAALAQGRGVILAVPHLGNWDEGGAFMAATGYPLVVVAEELEPPALFEWFVAQRRVLGLTAVPLGSRAAGAVSTALRDNRVVALLCDRDLGGTGVEVEFFGEVTRLPGGPALLALRTGAPILPSAVYLRDREGVHCVIRPPLPVSRTRRPLRDDVRDVTQRLAYELEELIRAAPEQWHVFQPNWPSDPGYGA